MSSILMQLPLATICTVQSEPRHLRCEWGGLLGALRPLGRRRFIQALLQRSCGSCRRLCRALLSIHTCESTTGWGELLSSPPELPMPLLEDQLGLELGLPPLSR